MSAKRDFKQQFEQYVCNNPLSNAEYAKVLSATVEIAASKQTKQSHHQQIERMMKTIDQINALCPQII